MKRSLVAHFEGALATLTDECVLWPFGTNGAGYGLCTFEGRRRLVHVVACERGHGPRPAGHEAAHGPCHNSLCFNPRHLSWKTPKENAADRQRDGTRGRKLSSEVAQEIRNRYAEGGCTYQGLADEYGVHRSLIQGIIYGTAWK